MGNAQYEDQAAALTFGQLLHETLATTVWSQTLAVMILLGLALLITRCMRSRVGNTSLISMSLIGSFFFWPVIYRYYLHLIHPKDFTNVLGPPDASMSGLLYVNLLVMPILSNQKSMLLVIVLFWTWILTTAQSPWIRWIGYVGMALALPAAWYLDIFNQGPS